MKTVYIHGAFSTQKCWNWLEPQLNTDSIFLTYSMEENMDIVLERFLKLTNDVGPYQIITHSMGGILGAHLAKNSQNAKQLITLSCPWKGINIGFMSIFSNQNMLMDINSMSPWVTDLKYGIKTLTHSIVSTSGHNALLIEPNDGVVTIKSQKSLDWPSYSMIESSHMEILMDPTTLKEIIFLTKNSI